MRWLSLAGVLMVSYLSLLHVSSEATASELNYYITALCGDGRDAPVDVSYEGWQDFIGELERQHSLEGDIVYFNKSIFGHERSDDEVYYVKVDRTAYILCWSNGFSIRSVSINQVVHHVRPREYISGVDYSTLGLFLKTMLGCGTQCGYDGEFIVIPGPEYIEIYISPIEEDYSRSAFEFSVHDEGYTNCYHEFEFDRRGIDLSDPSVRIHGTLEARVECKLPTHTGCVFELPKQSIVLDGIESQGSIQGDRLVSFNPLESPEYTAFSKGAFWARGSTTESGLSRDADWQRRFDAAKLCGEAGDRYMDLDYQEAVKALGATALIVADREIPLN